MMNHGHQTKDPYQVLGVEPDASADEIKRAYRRLAKKYHPDSTGGDKEKERRFKEISAAYDVLGDPEKRAQYDAMRSGPQGQPGFGGDFDFGDLFEQFFGGGAAAGGRPGEGVRYRVYTNADPEAGAGPFGGDPFSGFADLFGGAPRGKSRRRQRKSGERAERKVRAADGTPLVQRGKDIHSEVRLRLDQAVLGTVAEVSTLDGKASVRVPPGTSSGTRLRLRGKGAAGPDGKRGSHYVTVQIDVPKQVDEEAKEHLVQFMQKAK